MRHSAPRREASSKSEEGHCPAERKMQEQEGSKS